MEERLKRRKLDALKRGVHRATGEGLAFATHIVGIGGAGAAVIAQVLRSFEPGAPKLHALAVDIGDDDLATLREEAAKRAPEQASLTTVALEIPSRAGLLATLSRYRDYLRLEYPRYVWPAHYEPWLSDDVELISAEGHIRRAVAKAIYGQAYYEEPRRMERVLRQFAADVDAAHAQPVIAVVFGLGGGTGSGIAADLARHLSSGCFGRRALVVGIGIGPCSGDAPVHKGAQLFPVLSELDVMGDEGKNRGVVMSCGELFRNPFTAGFLLVPQQHVWDATQDLALTHQRCDQEIAALFATNGGANLWELLRLLNWVAAPSTQHSAARTPWGPKWVHMLGYADIDGPVAVDSGLPARLGLLPSYQAEFIEIRAANPADAATTTAAASVQTAFAPDVPPTLVHGGRQGSVQFILPCVSKLDLLMLQTAQADYENAAPAQRLLDHSLLLEHGVLLCAPSTRLAGMAGASLWGGDGWVAVPYADIFGGEPPCETEKMMQSSAA